MSAEGCRNTVGCRLVMGLGVSVSVSEDGLTLYGHIKTAEQRTIQQYFASFDVAL